MNKQKLIKKSGIKHGDFYACVDCNKVCGFNELTENNFPYCSRCKKGIKGLVKND